MKENIKITIVTVTLNPGKKNLNATIESILKQKYSNWELIVKDGGSSDNSLEIIPVDERIKIYCGCDSGIFDAMNIGIKLSSGDYICLLNAGDYFYDSEVLSKIVEIVNNYNDIEFIYGDVYKPLSRSKYEIYRNKLTRYYIFTGMICHQAWFIKKEYYIDNGFYETNKTIGADYIYLLKMIFVNKIKYKHLQKVIICYKGDGVSQDPNKIKESNQWRNRERKKIFGFGYYYIFTVINKLQKLIKKLIYDKLLYIIYIKIQEMRIK